MEEVVFIKSVVIYITLVNREFFLALIMIVFSLAQGLLNHEGLGLSTSMHKQHSLLRTEEQNRCRKTYLARV